MNYVLSVVEPPEPPAAYGRAFTFDPVPTLTAVYHQASYILTTEYDAPLAQAEEFASALIADVAGERAKHRTDEDTGVTFWIHPEAAAPHPCPCCGRLVQVTDHAYADAEDAYCLGCFTWSRSVRQCLPANSAHTKEP